MQFITRLPLFEKHDGTRSHSIILSEQADYRYLNSNRNPHLIFQALCLESSPVQRVCRDTTYPTRPSISARRPSGKDRGRQYLQNTFISIVPAAQSPYPLTYIRARYIGKRTAAFKGYIHFAFSREGQRQQRTRASDRAASLSRSVSRHRTHTKFNNGFSELFTKLKNSCDDLKIF